MDRQRAKVLLADCHEDPVIDLHALPRIVATRSRSVTGPATLGVGHACERVCKRDLRRDRTVGERPSSEWRKARTSFLKL